MTPASRARLPWAMLLAAGLCVAGEQLIWNNHAVLAFLARYRPPTSAADALVPATATWTLRTAANGAPPIVLLGSSQVREGLDCAPFLEQHPDRPCVNAGVSAGTPLDLQLIADRLASIAPRRTLIVCVFPKVFHLPVKTSFVSMGTLGSIVTSGSWRELSADQWADLGFGLVQRLLPTLRYKDALHEVRGVVRGNWAEAWRHALPAAPPRQLSEGDRQLPRYFERRVNRYEQDTKVGAYSPAQEHALLRLVDREAARGNPVFVVDFPTRPGYETTLYPDVKQHYVALFERLRARSAVVVVGKEELAPLTADDFLDFTHLSQGGREKVSKALALTLARTKLARASASR